MAEQSEELVPRGSMDFDVVIVGAGPAGLATVISLKQRAADAGAEVSVVVIEKDSQLRTASPVSCDQSRLIRRGLIGGSLGEERAADAN